MKPREFLWISWAALALGLAGCASWTSQNLHAEGAEASAFCIKGNGPPLAGGGQVSGAKINAGFKGRIAVTPDCSLGIESR